MRFLLLLNADLDDLTSGAIVFALLKQKGGLEEIATDQL